MTSFQCLLISFMNDRKVDEDEDDIYNEPKAKEPPTKRTPSFGYDIYIDIFHESRYPCPPCSPIPVSPFPSSTTRSPGSVVPLSVQESACNSVTAVVTACTPLATLAWG